MPAAEQEKEKEKEKGRGGAVLSSFILPPLVALRG
jgi:hypothetical protein